MLAPSTAEIAGRCVLIAQALARDDVIVDAEALEEEPDALFSTESIGIFVAHFVGTTHGAGRNRAGRSPVRWPIMPSGKACRLVIADRVSELPLAVLYSQSITDRRAVNLRPHYRMC